MAHIEKTVFLSYRRTDAPWALAVFQHLTRHGYDVFLDSRGIASGDFERVIVENIKSRAHFLLLLTPSALDRCSDPGDVLRREIESALDHRRNIVPLLLNGFDFRSPDVAARLTGKMAVLSRYNAVHISAEYFDAAMDRLRETFLSVPLHEVLHPDSSPAEPLQEDTPASAFATEPVTPHPSAPALNASFTLRGHSGSVSALAVTPDGRRAVSGSWDHQLKVWDLETCREVLTLKGHSAFVDTVAITPDGCRAISGSEDEQVIVWNLETGNRVHTFHQGNFWLGACWVRAVALTPDARRAVSASINKTLEVWDLVAGRRLHRLKGHTESVSDVAIAADGFRAISISGDDTLRVWDLINGRERDRYPSNGAMRLVLTADGLQAITASRTGDLYEWGLATGEQLRTRTAAGTSRALAASASGHRMVVSTGDSSPRVWSWENEAPLCVLEGHSDGVYALAMTSDGRRILTGSHDRTIKVWDLDGLS